MHEPSEAPLFVILLPLLSIFFLPIKNIHRMFFYLLVCALGLTNIWLLINLPSHFRTYDFGYGIVFMIDRYSWFFALVVNITWIITTIYSYSYVRYNFRAKAAKFHLYLSLVLSMVLATGFAGNLITLFLTYIISIPLIYPLIIFRDDNEAKAAGKFYLISNLLPALLIFLPGIFLLEYISGDLSFAENIPHIVNKPFLASLALALFVIGMAKNCVYPFNTWLPKTMSAPAPVCALIHSVVAINSGSIALIKIVVYIYGLDFLHTLTSKFYYAGWLTYLCGFTAIYAAYQAFLSDNMKVRFSQSTVSQLSYIITAILTATPTSILGASFHMLSHSIAKICLFFVAGFFNSVYNTVDIRQIGKIVPHTRWIALIVGICGMSIAGFPFMAGYFSKDLMLLEEIHSHNYSAALFLLIGSIINIFYIWPILRNAFFSKNPEALEARYIPFTMRLAMGSCLIFLILLSVYTFNIIRAFEIF